MKPLEAACALAAMDEGANAATAMRAAAVRAAVEIERERCAKAADVEAELAIAAQNKYGLAACRAVAARIRDGK